MLLREELPEARRSLYAKQARIAVAPYAARRGVTLLTTGRRRLSPGAI